MRLFFAALMLALLPGCLFQEEWTAFVYPNANDLSSHQEFGPFSSFPDCQVAAINNLRGRGLATKGDYECGLNCEYNAEWRTRICEETRS